MEHLEIIKTKIRDQNSLTGLLSFYRFKNYKIVFTNGCFDILHLGHIEYLAKAADFGDVLLIGLNTDDSVRKIKGPNRPVNNQESRALVLASLTFVNNVIYFDQDTPYNLIKIIQPDILVKGSDYKTEDIVGSDIVLAKNGEVKTIDFVEGFSTSNIINKLK
ncbi:MAG: D-glycero-beta-D-manno-heptose 1-phosphate adenylyltransferase [Bacteroidota bacterium]